MKKNKEAFIGASKEAGLELKMYVYEEQQFNFWEGPVKEKKIAYLCTGSCGCFLNTLLMKLCTS
jgi:hypothetical protein